MKTILIIILAVLSVALAGVLGYQKLTQPEVTPVVTSQTFSCASKTDCVLAYTGTSACAPCAPADASMQCVSPAEATRLQQERIKKHGQVYCDTCEKPSQEFTCTCQNGSCTKVAITQPIVNQPSASCVKEGEQGGTETNTIENRNLNNCCSGLNKVDLTTFWEGACENASGATIDTLFTCIKCGNGVCGKGENQCNCPQDCKTDETAGWKNYESAFAGFQFKYPAELQLSQAGTAAWQFITLVSPASGKEYDYKVMVSLDKTTKSLTEYIDSIVNKGTLSDYLLGGHLSAVKMVQQTAGGLNTVTVFTIQNGTIYEMEYSVSSNASDDIKNQTGKIFDQILSTFKFTK